MIGVRNRLPIVLWAALVVLATWLIYSQVRVVTDLALFLPRGATPVERLLVKQLREGPASRLILIALQGAPSETLARVSADLAQRLQAGNLFGYVNNGDASWSLREQELLLNNRYLLSPGLTRERFTTQALRSALEARLRDLASPSGALEKRLLPRDPTGELKQVLQAWAGGPSPLRKHGVWFSADGGRVMLVAETRAPAFDLDAQAQALAYIRQAFSAAAPDSESVSLMLSGPAVFAVEARDTIRGEAWRLSLLATGLVALFLFLVYRSFKALLFCGIPLLSGILAAVAGVGLFFGSIHGITVAFGITLIGVAVDYPIHLFSHRKPSETPVRTAARIWPTLRLGALTTALGYTAMLFSGFQGLSQLGLFAIVGLITAAVVTRWVLPVLASETKPQAALPWERQVSLTVTRLRRLYWLPVALIAAGLLYLVFLDRSPWETDLANLSPVPADRKALDRELRAELGVPDVTRLLVVYGDNAEDALQRSEGITGPLKDFIRRGIIAGFYAPSRYLPSKTTQRQRQAALPTESALRRALRQAMQGLPFRQDAFEPFVTDVIAARSRPLLAPDDFKNTGLGLRLGSLLFRHDGRWVALIPLRGVTDDAALTEWASGLNNPGVRYLNVKAATNRLVNRYRDEALTLFAWGAGAIALLLILGLRSVTAALRVLLPVGAAVIGGIVLLLVLDQRLSLFHLAALLLVVGIGLDYALFFNRVSRDGAEQAQTAKAVVVCGVTTALVFGILATSQIPVLNAIGTTLIAGVLLCLVLTAALSRDPGSDGLPGRGYTGGRP